MGFAGPAMVILQLRIFYAIELEIFVRLGDNYCLNEISLREFCLVYQIYCWGIFENMFPRVLSYFLQNFVSLIKCMRLFLTSGKILK